MLVVVSLELQVFHEISWIYQNSQNCLESSLNPKLIPKFPRSGENSTTATEQPGPPCTPSLSMVMKLDILRSVGSRKCFFLVYLLHILESAHYASYSCAYVKKEVFCRSIPVCGNRSAWSLPWLMIAVRRPLPIVKIFYMCIPTFHFACYQTIS